MSETNKPIIGNGQRSVVTATSNIITKQDTNINTAREAKF